jgi:hypothetical protein
MTEARAFALILVGCLLLVAVAVTGLVALGLSGPAVSLGAIVPLALAANAISRMVMHYGESGRRER